MELALGTGNGTGLKIVKAFLSITDCPLLASYTGLTIQMM
jgi:hypothetical protein